jgi:hypothetical protein
MPRIPVYFDYRDDLDSSTPAREDRMIFFIFAYGNIKITKRGDKKLFDQQKEDKRWR